MNYRKKTLPKSKYSVITLNDKFNIKTKTQKDHQNDFKYCV